MSEIKTIAVVAIICFLLGAAAGGGVILLRKAGEISEIEDNLRDAVERNREVRERIGEHRDRVAELERISSERYKEITELRDEVQFHIGRARERDILIAGLTAKVESIGGRVGYLGDLAAEGRGIVAELLAESDS